MEDRTLKYDPYAVHYMHKANVDKPVTTLCGMHRKTKKALIVTSDIKRVRCLACEVKYFEGKSK